MLSLRVAHPQCVTTRRKIHIVLEVGRTLAVVRGMVVEVVVVEVVVDTDVGVDGGEGLCQVVFRFHGAFIQVFLHSAGVVPWKMLGNGKLFAMCSIYPCLVSYIVPMFMKRYVLQCCVISTMSAVEYSYSRALVRWRPF